MSRKVAFKWFIPGQYTDAKQKKTLGYNFMSLMILIVLFLQFELDSLLVIKLFFTQFSATGSGSLDVFRKDNL